jgi:hypothetical protein
MKEEIIQKAEEEIVVIEKECTANHYVNNDTLLKEMILYKTEMNKFASGELTTRPRISEYIGSAILKIAERLSSRPNFAGYCVDEETEILTQRGWLKYSDITMDDKVVSYDTETKNLVWSPIKDIYIGVYDGKMHKLTNQGLDALVTPGHKFVTSTGITPVEMLKCGQSIILIGNPVATEAKNSYSDDFIEIVGWIVTEGCLRFGKNKHSIAIYQNKGPKADRIRQSLNNLKCHYKEYIKEDDNMVSWRLSGDIVKQVFAVISNNRSKALNPDFICSLNQHQRMLLINTMVDGDGWIRRKGYKSYIQKDKKHVDSFVMLCTLSRILTSTLYEQNRISFGKTTSYYTMNLYQKKECTVDKTDFHGGRSGAGGKWGKEFHCNKPTIDYNGKVWCVQTEYGSFMCRRGKYIYLTGNTFREEMVSDGIENAIMYLDNFDPEKSKNPFAYITQIIFFAFLRRIQKEKKQCYVKMKLFERADTTGALKDHIIKKYEIDPDKNNIYAEFFKLNENDVEYFDKKTSKIKENKNQKPKKISPLNEFMEKDP